MSAEELKAQIRRLGEVWSTGNVARLDEICTANVVYHISPFPDMNLEALKQFITAFHMAFPDFQLTFDEDIVAGNTTAHRWTCRATYTGQSPLLPVPPTGKQARVPGCHVAHWLDGKAVEMWPYEGWLGWLQQFGIIPPLE